MSFLSCRCRSKLYGGLSNSNINSMSSCSNTLILSFSKNFRNYRHTRYSYQRTEAEEEMQRVFTSQLKLVAGITQACFHDNVAYLYSDCLRRIWKACSLSSQRVRHGSRIVKLFILDLFLFRRRNICNDQLSNHT